MEKEKICVEPSTYQEECYRNNFDDFELNV